MRSTRRARVSPAPRPSAVAAPRWDAAAGELWLGPQLLWRRQRPARNLELILATFQEEGWPERIDDPLFGQVANARDRLHKAVKGLNRALLIGAIEFHRDGSGKGITWRLV